MTMGPPSQEKADSHSAALASAKLSDQTSTSNCQRRSQRRSTAVYECIFCSITFTNRNELETHLTSHVDCSPETESEKVQDDAVRQEALSCPVCNDFTTWRQDELQQHFDNHIMGYKCVFCDFTTLRKTRLRSHLPQHAFERNFKCELCGMGFYKNDLLSRHKKTHGPKNFACTQCDHTTYSQRMLNDHRILKHSSDKVHKCKECGQHFRHSADLSIHRRRIHNLQNTKFGKSDIKRCPDCTFETKRRPEFILHRYEVHESFPMIRSDSMELQCAMEGCTFSIDSELKFVTHIQAKHRAATTSSSEKDQQQCLSCRLCRKKETCTHTSSGRPRGSKSAKKKKPNTTAGTSNNNKNTSDCNTDVAIVGWDSAPISCNKDKAKETAEDSIKDFPTSQKEADPRPGSAQQHTQRQPVEQVGIMPISPYVVPESTGSTELS
ncbi:zinc finger protein 100-like isoform X1 [Varroa jacobsoni]|uniref:zinc finger protein 100-like isoform X1 n=1 Tax=Varroa jacobsoni TaxID=62625 RepID=UPI000BF3C456|nr:zinc finger protein 100-like isoform X1 [Varroa jacobsoni]XP_022695961.1 zinc finger protein 100-like isoform X1 [Varroa jacobsoni]XP_022695962.1 zinc finger protein 100-like isoform X1 [Varroa jacobsoni]XP_022695963.1 zinc finger protein 100-like isoform X1 [Varroa jacobsoni]